MATQSSFKQQCPSCEAMVPIRDPKLIGRKIDCPKCKYRFVVEEPVDDEEEMEDEAPAKKGGPGKKPVNGKAAKGPSQRRADDDEDLDDRPKKKQGGSGMLVVGIVLAGVALIALAVGAVFLFSGDSDDEKSSGGPSASATSSPSNSEPANSAPTKTDSGPKPRVDDITNLLPNNTQIVVNMPLEHLLRNDKLNQALLKTPGAFHDGTFQHIWGILPTDVRRVVLSYNIEKKAVFSVMRTAAALDEKQIVAGLKLKPEEPINGFKHYIVRKSLDALSTLLLKGTEQHDKVALHFMDQFTVVCADVDPMKQFLQEKGQPKQLSSQKAEEQEQSSGGGQGGGSPNMQQQQMMQQRMQQGGMRGGPPAGMQGGGRPPAGMQGGGPPPQGGGQQPPGAMTGLGRDLSQNTGPGGGLMTPPSMTGGSTSAGAAVVSSSYMTIDPHLKAALDQAERIDKNENQNVLLSLGASTSAVSVDYVKKNMTQQGSNIPQVPDVALKFGLNAMKNQLKAVAVAATEFSDSRVVVNAAAAAKDADLAQEWQKKITEAIPGALTMIGLDLVAKDTGTNNTPNAQAGMQGGMQGMMGMQGGGMQGNMQMQMQMRQRMMRQGMQGGMRGMQGGGAMPPGGGVMPPRAPGGGVMPPGGGAMPPGGPGGGMQPQDEGEKPEEKGKLGTYEIWTKDSVLAGSVNLNLSPALLGQVGAEMEFAGIELRSVMSMTTRSSRIHELAAAMQAYLEAKGQFPRGAVVRGPDSQRVLEWRPDQRLSWMTEILPYLANGEFKNVKTNPDKAWYEDPANMKAAFTVIPQFVAPMQTDKSTYYYVTYPNVPVKGPGKWAATHFVGIAGVGLDAAEYAANDSATAKKRGVFGYDRETKKKDITDGLNQTIVLIQVPPEPKSLWIAGGGSTVRGVSEDLDCVRPFVCTKYKNKDGKEVDGTFAIMADGKVRFIPATIDPKTFQAMCTIAGGDKVRNLEQVAPEVPPPEDLADEPELKTGQPAPAGVNPPVKSEPPAAKKALPPGWQEITSADGRFTIAVPAGQRIEKDTKERSPSGGELTGHRTLIPLSGNTIVYGIDYSDAAPGKRTEAMLYSEGMLQKDPGERLVYDKKITLDGYPGREYQVEGKNNTTMRIFLVKNRLYQLSATFPAGKTDVQGTRTFFDSFKLTGK